MEYTDYEQILNIGIALSTEKNRNRLMESILEAGMEITHCDASTLYLYEDNELVFKFMKTLSMGISRGGDGEVIEEMPPAALREENVCAYAAIHREVVNIPDVYNTDRFDFSGPKQYDALTGYHTTSQLVIPLENSQNELIGVLQLINALDEAGNVIPFDSQYHIIIRSLGSMAAIELTNLSYVEELKAQMRSFAEALAAVIDERTPYNGSHTRNVAKYAGMLADYITYLHDAGACEECFDESRRERLELAALVHDIGKMIVPLSVMNRATRLAEDIYAVEDRFRLLEAFYEIDMLKGRIGQQEYEEKCAALKEDLALIHKVNKMGYLDDENYAKIQKLADRKYQKEDGTEIAFITPKETECLSIRRGTLTAQDRIEMENHVVMTEKILSKVRFGKKDKDILQWAAAHHEFLDGSGYPKHLKGDALALETRILTVADIYDALTATDRPYKKPVSKECAIEILKGMAADGKIELRLVEWLDEALSREVEE